MAVTVPKRWPGATIVCLASGPSLTRDICDYLRGKARVIAINNAHVRAPWADVLYSSDRHWWPHHKGVPSFTGDKYGIGSAPGKRNWFPLHPEIRVLKNTGFDGLELEPTGLRNGENSGYAAINLAVHFGAARVLLVGYDMGIRGGKTHFFGNHVGLNNPTDATFVTFRKRFKSIVAPLHEIGVEVLNCTPGSSLDVFPMVDLRTALPAESVVAA